MKKHENSVAPYIETKNYIYLLKLYLDYMISIFGVGANEISSIYSSCRSTLILNDCFVSEKMACIPIFQ